MTTKFIIYRAKDGFRWRAKRGRHIVAESGEAYVRLEKARRSLDRFTASIGQRKFSVEER